MGGLRGDEVLDALLERLVDDWLSSRKQNHPTQALVARQFEAAAWLYYFHLKKSFPDSDYYDPAEFCRKAVMLRLELSSYVMDAAKPSQCAVKPRVDAAFAAAVAAPNAGRDGITKVAAALLSKDKKSCLIVKSLITRNIWSFLEKEIENGVEPLDCAYSAVQDILGISRGSLRVEEVFHNFRAMSQKRANTRLYVMVCNDDRVQKLGRGVEEARWIRLDDLLPKIKDSFISTSGWSVKLSSLVDYLHIYPVAGFLDQLQRSGDCDTIDLDDNQDLFVELITQNNVEANANLNDINNQEEDVPAVSIVPDSEDEGNDDGNYSSQLTQVSQVSPSPNLKHQRGTGLENTLSKLADESARKKLYQQVEACSNGGTGNEVSAKEAVPSQNESSNGAETATRRRDREEELRAKHLRLLQELQNVTANYEIRVRDLLSEIAESNAQLQKF